MIHKKILDKAQADTTASVEELAADISGASAELVERVLEQYGDPARPDSRAGAADEETKATDTESPVDSSGDDTMTDASTNGTTAEEPDISEQSLSPKQRDTLRAIAEYPDATQGELAEHLGVSRATVSNRVNDIPGFEWQNRQEFVETAFVDDEHEYETDAPDATTRDPSDQQIDHTAVAEEVAELTRSINELEQLVVAQRDTTDVQISDPELVHKVAHACLRADYIDEEEELEILRDLLAA